MTVQATMNHCTEPASAWISGVLACFRVEGSAVIRENLVAAMEEMAPVRIVGFADDQTSAVAWLEGPPGLPAGDRRHFHEVFLSPMHHLPFAQAHHLTPAALVGYGQSLGLNMNRYRGALKAS